MNYRTTRLNRFAGLLIAVLMTVAVNGAVLWAFDTAAQAAMLTQSAPSSPAIVSRQVDTVVPQS